MDVWAVGRAPAGAYSYEFPKDFVKKNPAHHGAHVSWISALESCPAPNSWLNIARSATPQVFFLPMRVIRGQAVPNKKEGLVGHAWLTKEEIKEKVTPAYWEAVEPMLSDL